MPTYTVKVEYRGTKTFRDVVAVDDDDAYNQVDELMDLETFDPEDYTYHMVEVPTPVSIAKFVSGLQLEDDDDN